VRHFGGRRVGVWGLFVGDGEVVTVKGEWENGITDGPEDFW